MSKPATRYFCLNCKRISKTLRDGRCPYCGGECEEIQISPTIWGRIGHPLALGVAFLIWGGAIIEAYLKGAPIEIINRVALLFVIPALSNYFAIDLIFSWKDEEIIREKISESKGLPAPVSLLKPTLRVVGKDEKVCMGCGRPVAKAIEKCPYCGYVFRDKEQR